MADGEEKTKCWNKRSYDTDFWFRIFSSSPSSFFWVSIKRSCELIVKKHIMIKLLGWTILTKLTTDANLFASSWKIQTSRKILTIHGRERCGTLKHVILITCIIGRLHNPLLPQLRLQHANHFQLDNCSSSNQLSNQFVSPLWLLLYA